MADQEQDSVHKPFHREGDAFVIDPPPDPKETARQRREDEQHEFARSQVKTNKNLAWFTGALVIATFCTIGVGIWQGIISGRSAKAAEDAAKAALCAAKTADSSLTMSRQQFAASQAAVLQPHIAIGNEATGKSVTLATNPPTAPVGERQWFIQIDLINAGKIAATHLSGFIKSSRFGQIAISDVTVPAQSPSYAYQSGFTTRRLMIHKGAEPFLFYDQFGGTKVFIDLRYFDGTEYIPAKFCYMFQHGATRPDDWQECN